ncbi:hypothetical protein PR003_g11777 [Phytophthora rubi]|uniref:Uncharacterized protein n=2 Tax=Phytophthora TaxID=4783 RepID=A0A6A4FBJ8_9STRA|nr:hypothetical protein PR002_g6430 [Phytophthora rubi]KAE9337900.1 hypothetical protein PR003_g11777 [Phytophthora rubi]KAE9357818.1 hypothetical protein PF008_g2979 [Phytophthora fragariae]
MSHDARAVIDDLREYELVQALKTCSEGFQSHSLGYFHCLRIFEAEEGEINLTSVAFPSCHCRRLDAICRPPGGL